MVVITPTHCPKSVCNRCVIEVLPGVLCCHLVFSVGVRAFVMGFSQLFVAPEGYKKYTIELSELRTIVTVESCDMYVL